MMKKNIFLFVSFLLISFINFSQTNVYPPNGNVGIGTTNPTEKLDLSKDSYYNNVNDSGIKLGNSNEESVNNNTSYGYIFKTLGDQWGARLSIIQKTRAENDQEIFSVKNHNIGIGNINPTEKLDLSKDVYYNSVNNSGIKLGNSNDQSVNNNTSYAYIFKTLGDQSGARLSIVQKTRAESDQEVFSIKNGNIGIGTIDSKGYKLGVKGKIAAEEVKVALYNTWPDFVFEKEYNLPTLQEVENHIIHKGHLKDIPSAKEVEKNGIQLGEMNAKLLQKIEELTLYMIEQNKKTEQLQKEVILLKKKIK